MNIKPSFLFRLYVSVLFMLTIYISSSCKSKQESLNPVRQSITESVYASGIIVSKNQYEAFTTVNGIVDEVFVEEGETVQVGTPILSIANDAQVIAKRNAQLAAEINSLSLNRGKINEAEQSVNLIKSQLENEEAMLKRQQNLFAQNIGTKVELEQKELAVLTVKNNLESAKERLSDLERQLTYLSKQAKNNLLINKNNVNDYVVKSKIAGKVYQMNLSKGEVANSQKAIAIIGDNHEYLLKMQIDEYDIVDVKLGMPVMVVLNSYRDSVFDAVVTKIHPIMNVESKTFTIEAEFAKAPSVLYPNISFEANILINTKKDALLIPRSYLINDSIVVNKAGEQLIVKTGSKDYQMVEIIAGLDESTELIQP